jgi:putative N6-adenine-specific DNA methylase/tRNA (guanine6-N2)-methyltransferase
MEQEPMGTSLRQVDGGSDPDDQSALSRDGTPRSGQEWQIGPGDLFFTTNPGLEDIVVAEFDDQCRSAGLEAGVAQAAPFGLPGHVLVRHASPASVVEPLAWQMRSIHHVLRPLAGFPLPAGAALTTIRQRLLVQEIAAMHQAASFRVTTRRLGQHDFTSLEVQRIAGAALVERYGVAVDLDHPAVNVRVDVFADFCLLSVQLSEQALSLRHQRRYHSRAALKGTVAYALLRLAGVTPGTTGALLDPCCGSGTILLEAAQLSPGLALYGCDLQPAAASGACANLAAADLATRSHVCQLDLRHLDQVFPPDRFCAVVTNPPYGVKLGQRLHFPSFYQSLLEQVWRVLEPDGLLSLMVWRRGVFVRAVNQFGRFRLRHLRAVETGGIYPHLFVLHKPAGTP